MRMHGAMLQRSVLAAVSVMVSVLLGLQWVSRASAGTVTISTRGELVSTRPLSELELVFTYFPAPGGSVSAEREEPIPAPALPFWDFGSPVLIYRITTTFAYEGDVIICIDSSAVYTRFAVSRAELRIANQDVNGNWQVLARRAGTGDRIICSSTPRLGNLAVVQPFGLEPVTFTAATHTAGNVLLEPAFTSEASGQSASPHGTTLQFPSMPGAATLTVMNGVFPTTGAQVRLNGEVVGTGELFKRHVNNLTAPVSLLAGQNTLEVSVNGGPDSSFSLFIQGVR